MSTAAATLDTRAFRRPTLTRLTAVELRKMTDTRAGFWVQLAVVAITIVLVVVVSLVGNTEDHTLRKMLEVAIQPSSILLPVVGVLLVTSEWSQRTTLITFTLVPHRSRVLVAKLAASVVLAMAALVLCLAIAILATAIAAPGVANTWALPSGLARSPSSSPLGWPAAWPSAPSCWPRPRPSSPSSPSRP
jgi:ABC-2 type transport system permease protein